MNFLNDILPWITQGVMGAILLWLALRKAPVERQTLDATTAAQYAQAAKLKGEENDRLTINNARLEAENEVLRSMMAGKRYKVIVEFTIGDPPEPGKVTIEAIEPIETIQAKEKK